MKKISNLKKFFGIAIAASVCCFVASLPSSAVDVTPAQAAIYGRYEQGGITKTGHDMMRYNKENQQEESDYEKYSQRRYGTERQDISK